MSGCVAQQRRVPPCHGGGRGFKSRHTRHSIYALLVYGSIPMCLGTNGPDVGTNGRIVDATGLATTVVIPRKKAPGGVGSTPTERSPYFECVE